MLVQSIMEHMFATHGDQLFLGAWHTVYVGGGTCPSNYEANLSALLDLLAIQIC